MGLPLTTTVVEYAYVNDLVMLPNIEMDGEFKHRISVTFDLRDEDKVHVQYASIEYYSEGYKALQTYKEYTSWRNDNESKFISQGKTQFSGYEA